MTTAEVPAKLSLRERGKRDRRRRIEIAALEVFRDKGFEAATIREIAERADVGVATLFAYARDKHDLLLMVFNERLETITELSLETLDETAPLIEQLMHLFGPRYELWGEDPHLSRYAVQQSFSIPTRRGEESENARFLNRRARLLERIVELVKGHQSAGAVKRSIDPHLVAALVLDIFLSETRGWLVAEQPILTEGFERLRNVLSLAAAGFNAKP